MSDAEQQQPTAADLSDDELLERIAALDPEKYPLAPIAERALNQEDSS